MSRCDIFITMVIALSAADKPPVPTDMAFIYDPNLCKSQVVDWLIAEPNVSLVYAIRVHNAYGREVSISVTGNDADVLIDPVGKAEDPNGGWNQYFQIVWTPPPLDKLYYVEFTATDSIIGQGSCTVLVYAAYEDVPVIWPVRGQISANQIKQAQKLVQVAKKAQFPLTKPVHILRRE